MGRVVALIAEVVNRPDDAATEDEPVVDAASLVQPALLSGPGFSVDPHVELRGYMAHFTLDTPYGPLDADSVEILAERETELPALDALDRATHSDAFVHAAGDKFVATGNALGKIVFLADGSALFSKALGIDYDAGKGNMGVRARRGVIHFDQGVVSSIDIEEPGKFEVSSAEACMTKLG